MKIKQVRHATVLIEFGGIKFLIDPYLAKQGAYSGFEGTVNSHLNNPQVELQTPLDEILNVDAVIVTHTHSDHWDEAAMALVPKSLPIFAQHQQDADLIQSAGFTDVRILRKDTEGEGTNFGSVTLIKTPGQHGSAATLAAVPTLGKVCGIVFKHSAEKTLYLAGDTVWNQSVRDTLVSLCPDIIILNTGDAQIPGLGSITMGKDDVKKVYNAALNAMLITNHMEAVNHCVLTRRELREFAAETGITERLLVPEDNEAYRF
jgi:L-ascorbate metabolism protein UlaG (beta-lactamase superfamily)